MTRIAFAIGLALIIGCSQDAPANKGFAKVLNEEPQAEKMPPVVVPEPAKSDPAAEALLVALAKSHTKDNSALLEQLKTISVKREGEMNSGSGGSLPAYFSDRVQWPDNYRAEWQLGSQPTMTLAFRGEKHWQHIAKENEQPTPMNPAMQTAVVADRDATLMTLLLPLVEKDRVAMTVPTTELPAGFIGVRVWVRNMAPMVLGIDTKTGLLARVWFEKTEFGRTASWRYVLKEHQAVNGILLPSKLVYSAGATPGAEWNTIKYEFPMTFDAALFEKP